MTATVSLTHNFETAHRLPQLAGKCTSLHGHSWWVEVTVAAPEVAGDGTVVEFGAFKAALRAWVDEHLDHGSMLQQDDPLADALEDHGCKVHRTRHWPTVENTAAMLAGVAHGLLGAQQTAAGARVERVHVQETHVNAADWVAS